MTNTATTAHSASAPRISGTPDETGEWEPGPAHCLRGDEEWNRTTFRCDHADQPPPDALYQTRNAGQHAQDEESEPTMHEHVARALPQLLGLGEILTPRPDHDYRL